MEEPARNQKVTVVIPCRNEEKYIREVLQNLLVQDYPAELLEVFVIDGQSEDNTGEIIREFAAKNKHIRHMINRRKTVPHALNLAIIQSTGSIILRMDAHSRYPQNYISALVTGLSHFKCDNAGGSWITEPANSSLKARAIADATSHPFGIGNAYYRLEVKSPKKVDTVPYGCYRREVFDRIGLFDEDLIRNQDDEFNARLIANGGVIYLLPDVKIRYFARENCRKTSRMFFQYGLFKPLVNLKVGKPATLRQFVPPLFALFILSFSLLGILHSLFWTGLLLGLSLYLLADMMISASILMSKSRPASVFWLLVAVFPLIHLSYGIGYLAGMVRFVILRRSTPPSNININR
jgi:glycosyltransferase involved in cell wall biosynthesis